jgi:hypothetical protein
MSLSQIRRPWWRFLTTMPRRPGGASGRTGPRRPPSLRRECWWCGRTVAWCRGSRRTAPRPRHTRCPTRPRCHRRTPGAGAGARQRTAGPLQRCPGRVGAVAGVPRPRRLAQQHAERGIADPHKSRVAGFSGARSCRRIRSFPLSFMHPRVS